MNVQPDPEMLKSYRDQGGKGLDQAGVKACWAADEKAAVKTAHLLWANSGIPGEAAQEFRMPQHFEQASRSRKASSASGRRAAAPLAKLA